MSGQVQDYGVVISCYHLPFSSSPPNFLWECGVSWHHGFSEWLRLMRFPGWAYLQCRKLLTGMYWLKVAASRLRLISVFSPATSRTDALFSSSNTCHCFDAHNSNMKSSEGKSARTKHFLNLLNSIQFSKGTTESLINNYTGTGATTIITRDEIILYRSLCCPHGWIFRPSPQSLENYFHL